MSTTDAGSSPAGSSELSPSRAAVADRVIAAMAGPDARLREDQTTAVAALCSEGARVLVVQATGWGKSAVYWAATAIRRAEGHGPTLVVSPLLSLMRDQVAAAGRAGLRAATLNSSNIDAWSSIEAELVAGELDVLLVSPERLANPGFGRRVLDSLAGSLGLLVIDEAHAVSDWGHDFRPDYRRVSDVLQRLNPSTPVLATTATANARVTDDVAQQLGHGPGGFEESGASSSGDGGATLVLRGALARASLELSVVDRLTPLERYAWVVDHLPKLAGSGIVYTLTVADAERLTEAVRAVHGDTVPVAAYTGQLEASAREGLEDALRRNELKALIATSALGMGYDKPDLGFVIHVGSPPSPVSYYQQVGRAGRAISHAHAVLLPSDADSGVWDYFATATIPVPEQVRRVLDVLGAAGLAEPMSVAAVEAQSGVRRGRVELMLKVRHRRFHLFGESLDRLRHVLLGRVAVGQHEAYARCRLGRRRIEMGDAAHADRGPEHEAVQSIAGVAALGGVGDLARDLARPFGAVDAVADHVDASRRAASASAAASVRRVRSSL